MAAVLGMRGRLGGSAVVEGPIVRGLEGVGARIVEAGAVRRLVLDPLICQGFAFGIVRGKEGPKWVRSVRRTRKVRGGWPRRFRLCLGRGRGRHLSVLRTQQSGGVGHGGRGGVDPGEAGRGGIGIGFAPPAAADRGADADLAGFLGDGEQFSASTVSIVEEEADGGVGGSVGRDLVSVAELPLFRGVGRGGEHGDRVPVGAFDGVPGVVPKLLQTLDLIGDEGPEGDPGRFRVEGERFFLFLKARQTRDLAGRPRRGQDPEGPQGGLGPFAGRPLGEAEQELRLVQRSLIPKLADPEQGVERLPLTDEPFAAKSAGLEVEQDITGVL